MVGQTVSHYRIIEKLGEGGMGVVYKAGDTKLRRTVALKFLPPDNRDRFLREAQAAAALNHPNICTVFEIDEQHGFLAIEFINGPSLKDKITARPLPLDEALDIAQQACAGLAAAHEKGIVHRDIKPANLMLTAQGQVKIMDFGLAQLGDRTRITKTGSSLGTPAYMSPEQAKGEAVDRRTDLWSLGVVIYEMIAGRPPFRGDTEQAVSYGIVHSQPEPLTAQRTGLPLDLDRIAAKALAKDPAARYQHADDLRVDLARTASLRPIPAASATKRYWLYAIGGAFAGAAAILTLLTIPAVRQRIAPSVSSLSADATLTQITTYSGTERDAAISPDGRYFAFVSAKDGRPDIWVRQVSGGEAVRLTNDDANETELLYARDGESIYYTSAGSIWRLSALGGVPRKIVDGGRNPSISADGSKLAYLRGATIEISGPDGLSARRAGNVPTVQSSMRLSPDGKLVAYNSAGLMVVNELFIAGTEGAPARQITRFHEGASGNFFGFDWTPDSRGIIVSRVNEGNVIPLQSDLWIVPIDGGPMRRLTLNKLGRFQNLHLSADGRRLIATLHWIDYEIWKAPLGPDPVTNGKQAVRLIDRSGNPMWIHRASARPLLMFNAVFAGTRNLWTLDLETNAPPRQLTQFRSSAVTHAALSPDGSRVAYASLETGNSEIWVMNSDGSNPIQITRDRAAAYWPAWSADGKWLAFGSTRNGSTGQLWRIPSNGGTAVPLTQPIGIRGGEANRPDWASDNRIAYLNNAGIVVADFDGKVLRQIDNPGARGTSHPNWSPDATRISALRPERTADSVWIFDAATGAGRKVIQFPDGFRIAFRAIWTPDAKSLIVNRSEATTHIVLLENLL
jgi:serine/threonine protein kinase